MTFCTQKVVLFVVDESAVQRHLIGTKRAMFIDSVSVTPTLCMQRRIDMQPLEWTVRESLPALNLRTFVQGLQRALPKLLKYLVSNDLRRHPVWGQLLPFDVPAYGTERSLGHIVRPDVILTPEGPKVCEFDFVPSGRGWVLASLPTEWQQERFLQPFADWYHGMGVDEVAYATATTTTCWPETMLFARLLREAHGVKISAINIDEAHVNGALVDRLFYRSEMARPTHAEGKRIITAEPHLDSKLVMALVHDMGMTKELEAAIGAENLAFLRNVVVETMVVERVRGDERFMASVAQQRRNWVLKNSDVESSTCWGSRGVVMGCKYGAGVFAAALNHGVAPNHKALGRHPVLQRFVSSVDFAPVWNAIVKKRIRSSPSHVFGMPEEDSGTHLPPRKHVYARVGVYLLVDNVNEWVHIPPYGACTLRQDELAHGARDALSVGFEIR